MGRHPGVGDQAFLYVWALLAIVIGSHHLFVSTQKRRERAQKHAAQAGRIFPWMSAKRIEREAKVQFWLSLFVPPIFLVAALLIFLGVLHPNH